MAWTTYTAVIATRNRPEALALSLPLLLAQSRAPAKVLVVDSSDPAPAETNAATVGSCAAAAGCPVEYMTSMPGAAIQRNIGLAQVETDVVFYPDDDSFVYPGALAAMMRIYDLDTEGRVGGVCSAEAKIPPPGVFENHDTYSMRLSDQTRAKIAPLRYWLEDRLFPDPFARVAERLYARQDPAPTWLRTENAITVPSMTGFRMSFRVEAIRRRGFCEELGQYALYEDTDAGFGILDRQILVGARNAQIYHHKFPGRRANGRAMGAMQILNRAYVVARSGERDAEIRSAMRRFSLYKITQYALALPGGGTFARERLAGARAAHRIAPKLFVTSPGSLAAAYTSLRTACFRSES
jgi:hypothetical protein